MGETDVDRPAATRLFPAPRLVLVGWGLWAGLGVVSAALLAGIVLGNPTTPSPGAATFMTNSLLTCAGLWLLGMCAWGFLLGRRRLWRHLAFSGLLVVSLLIFVYVAAMAVSPDPGADDAVAMGAIFLTVPLSVLVAVLLGLGGLLGAATRPPQSA
jgi:hypothetical protein